MVRLGRPISTTPPKSGGARHFAGELCALQGIMTGDGKLTTSHPVTECRNQTAQSRLGRAFRGFWRNSNNLRIGHMNDAAWHGNSGAKPRLQALVARLYCFVLQFSSRRQILISVGFSFF
jgi:hypothetical protein